MKSPLSMNFKMLCLFIKSKCIKIDEGILVYLLKIIIKSDTVVSITLKVSTYYVFFHGGSFEEKP